MSKKFTSAANSYVAARRRDWVPGEADWFEVAEAYDAGLYHGVNARASAQKVLAELAEASEHAEPPTNETL